MMKKRVLIASYNMIVGGSTTALIGLLNAFDTTIYDVDLILKQDKTIKQGKSRINITKTYDN